MRCFALGQYWRDIGRDACFIGQFPASVARHLDREGIQSVPISKPYPAPSDIKYIADHIPEGVPVVLDGYKFDATYQRRLATGGRRLMVIDDNGHLPEYAGDLLLNPTSIGEGVNYPIAPALRLIGTRYALLGRGFRRRAGQRRAEPHVARKILITMGGADRENATLNILEALPDALLDQTTVRVILGPANTHRQALQNFCTARNTGIELVSGNQDMPALMDWADLTITTAGTTSWEIAFMGVPSISLITADNQELIARDLHNRNATIYLGPVGQLDRQKLVTAVEQLRHDREHRRQLSRTARHLVDGEGVVRITAAFTDNFGINQATLEAGVAR